MHADTHKCAPQRSPAWQRCVRATTDRVELFGVSRVLFWRLRRSRWAWCRASPARRACGSSSTARRCGGGAGGAPGPGGGAAPFSVCDVSREAHAPLGALQGHAGTVPMVGRRDSLAAAAAVVSAIEAACGGGPGAVKVSRGRRHTVQQAVAAESSAPHTCPQHCVHESTRSKEQGIGTASSLS